VEYKIVQPFALPKDFFASRPAGLWIQAERTFGGWTLRAIQLSNPSCGQTFGAISSPPYPSAQSMQKVAETWLHDVCQDEPYSLSTLHMLDYPYHSPVVRGVAFLALDSMA